MTRASKPLLGVAPIAALLALAAALAACEVNRDPPKVITGGPSEPPTPPDPRVPCPPGTKQVRDVTPPPRREIQIYCEDAEGSFEGPYKVWSESGQLVEEHHYHDGDYDGVQRTWHANGQLRSEWTDMNGKAEGVSRSWHPNGRLATEIHYLHGEKVGIGRWWDERGRLTSTERYGARKPAKRAAGAVQ